MAVPAHDLRDWEFAVQFELPIIPVVEPPSSYEPTKEETALTRQIDGRDACPFAGQGTAINSGRFDGLSTNEFKRAIIDELAGNGVGQSAVNFRLRDWLFSRQHFWGEPFPVWHELDDSGEPTGLMRTDPVDQLPVTLPEMADFKPTGTPDPPLSNAPESWRFRTDDDGVRLARETNSMPQWAGSCWYYLRFADSGNNERFIDPALEAYWLPVDLYIGGAEHAVLHLLYSRFWHKVLFDRGHLTKPEPFQRLVNQGMILGEAEMTGYQSADGSWVSAADVSSSADEEGRACKVDKAGQVLNAVSLTGEQATKKGSDFVLTDDPSVVVDVRAHKMSKSRGNVINPDDIVQQYGADSLRLYEMFMGPLEATKPWSMRGVEGVYKFLGRVWRMTVDERADDVVINAAVSDDDPTAEQLKTLHRTIKAVTEDIEKLSFNTAISRMMEFSNAIGRDDSRPRSLLRPFMILLSPFAPHLAEELWQVLGSDRSLAYEPWPTYDPAIIAEREVEVVVQVNGKLRSRIQAPADADRDALEQLAKDDERVAASLEGKSIKKVIVVPGRLVNFVVK